MRAKGAQHSFNLIGNLVFKKCSQWLPSESSPISAKNRFHQWNRRSFAGICDVIGNSHLKRNSFTNQSGNHGLETELGKVTHEETREKEEDHRSDNGTIMKILNVAEKNDAAKRIAGLLSNGQVQTVSKTVRYFLN